MHPLFISIFLSFTVMLSPAVGTVPLKNTFKFVNTGDYVEYPDEYDTWFRAVDLMSEATPNGRQPYQVCFYNTTPGEYTLAFRLKWGGWESVRRWVWEANRGNPVGENAVFSLLRNGNLVLVEADGRVVWQTNTAGKGVVGYRFLYTGNLVLYDAKNRTIWQSFDHPTSTLVTDQYLKLGGPAKIVSRATTSRTADGPYSLELEPAGLAMYYTSPVDKQKYKYFSSNWFPAPLNQVTLSSPRRVGKGFYEISLDSQSGGRFALSRTNFNPSYSFLRITEEGNLKLRLFIDDGDREEEVEAFTLLANNSRWGSECDLPGKCGSFGLCQDNKCVACPRGNSKTQTASLLPWKQGCRTQTLKSCLQKDFYYYQLVGVDHFSTKYSQGEGPTTRAFCSAKCTNNCNCKGFFYHEDTKRCWAINDLKTLIKVKNNGHVAFIKAPK